MIQDVSIKYRVCQQRHCHNNHTHKLKSIKTSRSLTHGTQLTSYIIATMMSNRRYQTILLLLLLLHAITVHSFSNDAAAIITGAMTMNSKLLAWQAAVVVRRSLLYRSTHHHRRHHGRGVSMMTLLEIDDRSAVCYLRRTSWFANPAFTFDFLTITFEANEVACSSQWH